MLLRYCRRAPYCERAACASPRKVTFAIENPQGLAFPYRILPAVGICFCYSYCVCSDTGETAAHDFFRVSLDHSFTRPVSGRLLLFIAPKPQMQRMRPPLTWT